MVPSSDVRIPRARLIVAVAALIVCAAILWLARNFTFYFDEWDFIQTAPDWTWTSYLEPHNEHLTLLPHVVYGSLLGTVGLRSYLPYMVVLLLLHATNAVLLFELVRRRVGDLAGLACAALLLVLGAGWENLLWAFQMAFVGAVACGLGMVLVLEDARTPSRLLVAAALLTASLMFSGIGLFFGVAAAVRLSVTPDRRRDLLWLAPVAVMFAAWYVVFGRHGSPPNPPPSSANLALLAVIVSVGT